MSETDDCLMLTLSHISYGNKIRIDVIGSGASFCALLLTLEYDSNVFSLEDARLKKMDNELDLTYSNVNGRIIFLIDGKENHLSNGDRIVSFTFSFDADASGKFDFSLFPDIKNAACYLSDGEIKHLSVVGDGCKVSIEPKIRSCNIGSVKAKNFDKELILTGKIYGDIGFSAGFEVSFFYGDTNASEILTASRVISQSDAAAARDCELEFYLTIPVSIESLYRIEVVPFSCFRDGTVFGKKREYSFLK